ncbi:cytochrome c oxidase subunit II [Anabaena cylindrica UHCC 0172]|uniref:cytochrome c oxidase subunit II n=1 Tax=Anabaena cylindrica TaxID=1165 RepID=UPI002B2102D1|nr:cytochrome c oxidase subunit II [Anabaena cylindrica]MEA5554540.1 cytochrome c oxidase subunit II [Anabaena cylindrica UHCC 0172]
MKIPSSIWTLLIGIVLTLASLWYGQNHGLLPTAASDEAVLVDGLFNTMMIVSTGIFLLVEGILIYAAVKYRRRAGDNEDGPAIEGNVPLEILWTAIPAIIVLGISVYSFDVYNEIGGFDPHSVHAAPEKLMMQGSMPMPGTAMAATLGDTPSSTEPNLIAQVDTATPQQEVGKPPQLVINVSALQYAWIFTYPDTGVTTGELHVPIGQQVEMNMTASDVIHAFWVPEFRLKQDVIPGRQSEIRFTPNKIGEYSLICAELCGPYHGAMKTQVVVESQEAYDTWMQEQLVASKETLNQAVAINPTDLSADEFLAPYTKEMGIHPEMLHFHRSSGVAGVTEVTE